MNNKKKIEQEKIAKDINDVKEVLKNNSEFVKDLKDNGYLTVMSDGGFIQMVQFRQSPEIGNTAFQAPYNFFLQEKDFDNFFNPIRLG